MLRSKGESKGKLTTFGIGDQSRNTTKSHKFCNNYRLNNIQVHVHKKKPMSDTTKKTLGEMRIKIPEGNAQVVKAARVESSRQVDLLLN